MWPFQRSTRKYDRAQYEHIAYDLAHRPLPQVEGPDGLAARLRLANHLGDILGKMLELAAARRTANATDIAAIDEEMDRLCRELTADAENPQNRKRIRRMKEIMLAEILDVRNKARMQQ